MITLHPEGMIPTYSVAQFASVSSACALVQRTPLERKAYGGLVTTYDWWNWLGSVHNARQD